MGDTTRSETQEKKEIEKWNMVEKLKDAAGSESSHP